MKMGVDDVQESKELRVWNVINENDFIYEIEPLLKTESVTAFTTGIITNQIPFIWSPMI